MLAFSEIQQTSELSFKVRRSSYRSSFHYHIFWRSLYFVFVFHYKRTYGKSQNSLSTQRRQASVGIDQVAELGEIRTHKTNFLFKIHFPLVSSATSTKSPRFVYPLSDESSSDESHESSSDKPSGQFSFFPFDVQPSKFFLSLSLAYMDHRNQFNQGPLVSFREALQ